jgi:hypothetical protein
MILLILFLKLPKNQPLEDFPGSRLANRTSQDGATNYRIAVARVTLRRGKSGGAEPHTKGVGRTCLNYAL